MRNRSVLLIACSVKEAETIRERAAFERRTMSAYVLQIVMRNAAMDEQLFEEYGKLRRLADSEFTRRPTGPRTTMLLRCASQESARVRTAAKRRAVTISGFVPTGERIPPATRSGRLKIKLPPTEAPSRPTNPSTRRRAPC